MKIFNEKGSKERLFEMMQNVNRVKLNENYGQFNPKSVLDFAFEELKNNKLTVNHSNSQANGDDSFIELLCTDKEGNNITFTFKATSSEGDQEGVYNINNVMLTTFSFDDVKGGESIDLDESGLREFNAQHGGELFDVVQDYLDVEDETPEAVDELYEDAIKKIDSYPFGGGSDRMVKPLQYADEKPTNAAVRVNAPELKKVVEDFSLNPDEKATMNREISRFKSVAAPKPVPEPVEDEPVSDVDDEKKKIILDAYDNIMRRSGDPGHSPTMDEISAEINRMTGIKVEKKRVYPKEAEPFLENTGIGLVKPTDPTSVETTAATQMNQMSPETKNLLIKKAAEMIDFELGVEKYRMPKEQYNNMIREKAMKMFTQGSAIMNEEEKSDYPKEMGKEFSPEKQYRKKEKKYSKKIKLKEDEEAVSDVDSGGNLSIGDVVTVEGLGGEYQVGVKYSENKPFLMPFDMQSKKANSGHRIYLTSLNNPKLTKVLGYSETQGGFMSESEEVESDDNVETEPVLDKTTPMNGEDKEEMPSGEPQGGDAEQIVQDKEKVGDMIHGGKADEKSPTEYDLDQIIIGLDVEKEHTDNPLMAIEIAMDHLEEFPDYYTRLKAMEDQARAEEGEGGTEGGPSAEGDKETTDALLGYKPLNVGDEVEGDEEQEEIPEPESPETPEEPETPEAPEEEPEEEKKEDGLGESKESELKQRDPATWHQIQIAKKTLRMPGAMANVMGGMSKEEAKRILTQRGIKFTDEAYDFAAQEVEYDNADKLKKYQEYKQKDFDNLRDSEKEEFFDLWKQFKDAEQ